MAVHPVAARGFNAAEVYERGRPGYPPDAVAWLCSALGLAPASLVVDVAAGTGKLTEELVAFRVVAVEPVASMGRLLRTKLPSVPVVAGVAEHLPLRTGSVDAITVAQAFHWFAAAQALGEFRRVLRPGGRVGLLWNVRDRTVAWVDSLWQIMDRVEKNAPWRDHERDPERGLGGVEGFGELHRATFSHVHSIDRATLIDRFLSVSHVAVLPPEEQRAVIDEVLAVVDGRHWDGKMLALPYRVDGYWLERL
jgi:SAM-dependent methyltransferase